jgi:hypothetical protein
LQLLLVLLGLELAIKGTLLASVSLSDGVLSSVLTLDLRDDVGSLMEQEVLGLLDKLLLSSGA